MQAKADKVIQKELAKVKNTRLVENSFTYSLSQAQDKQFIDKLIPSIQKYQQTRSPVGASSSKSNNLLRNTFSMEVYQEFLKFKKDKAKKRQWAKIFEESQVQTLEKLENLYKQDQFKYENMKKRNFTEKMEIMKDGRRQKD